MQPSRTATECEVDLVRKTTRLCDRAQTLDTEKPAGVTHARLTLRLTRASPCEDLLSDVKALMIVPQGPIVGLPFEALVDTGSGGFLIDRWAVSYAPNATMALTALTRASSTIKHVTAILDVDIDDFTYEGKGIKEASGLQLTTLYSNDVLPDKLPASLVGAESAHLLLHGEFDPIEPLLSTLSETSRRSPALRATDLLSLPPEGMKLVVLSACESGYFFTFESRMRFMASPWPCLRAALRMS